MELCWISYAFFQFVLRNTGKMFFENCLKTMKLGNETLLQYYCEQIISVAARTKKFLDA